LAVAVGEFGGRPVAVSGGLDRTVRVWDLVLLGLVVVVAAVRDLVDLVPPRHRVGAPTGW